MAKLDPALLGALRRAATAAADDGVRFLVDSGWRSREYQEQLLQEAVAKYGSEEEAARWVATPDTSAHVSGDAVDLGPAEATAWLSKHGAAYGLCQIYRNEPWHYELRPDAVARLPAHVRRPHPRSEDAAVTSTELSTDMAQLTAFLTKARILVSHAAVRSVSANDVGHIAPSSRLAASSKPNVAYRVLNLSALLKKQTILPSLA